MPNTAYLAVLQLFFALTWVVYVIYLPALAAQSGIDKRYVPWILMMDQAIFVACDWAAGVFADRVAGIVGRLGRQIAVVALVSCAAFLALPWIAPHLGAPAFLAVTALWSITSSALRAPPFVLFARHSSEPRQAWLAGTYLFGFGLAAAAAPLLASALKSIDPRVPFALASIFLAASTFALVHAEGTRRRSPAPAMPATPARPVPAAMTWLFALAVLLFGLGFQIHFSLNSAPAYLRFAQPPQLERLMPVFWIGFNLAVLPATLLARRFGGGAVMAAAGVAGIAALHVSARASDLPTLVGAQLVAGAAWGIVLMSAFTAAIETGRAGREGFVTGLLFSMLAAAAFARIAMLAGNVAANEQIAGLLPQLPAMAWLGASVAVTLVATRRKS